MSKIAKLVNHGLLTLLLAWYSLRSMKPWLRNPTESASDLSAVY